MSVTATLALAASNARRVVGAFRAGRAVTGSSARRLADLRVNLSPTLRELINARIVRKAGADRYYLDEDLWARRRQVSGRTLLRVAIPAALALAAGALWVIGR